jgi:hypothetical protein
VSERDLALDEFVQAAIELAEASIRRPPHPDFAEAVARAHAIDPGAVPATLVASARALAEVVPLAHANDPGPDGALAGFLADVRSANEHALDDRQLAAIPVPARERNANSPRWLVRASAAAAAVCVMGVSAAMAFEFARSNEDSIGSEAVALVEPPAARLVERDAPRVNARVRTMPTIAVADTLEHVEESAEDRNQRPPRTDIGPSLEDRLRRLDAEAQAHWREGDLEGAIDRFEEIVRIGGRSHFVQLAYGDLFTIAHTRGPKTELALWKRYLARFPEGPHADDARAGQCRLNAGEATGCWADYLRDFPQGAHRARAAKAIGGSP